MTMTVVAACLLTAGVTLAVVVLGVNVFGKDVSLNSPVKDIPTQSTIAKAKTSEKETGGNTPGKIIIPGFAQLTLKAGIAEQDVNLRNPEENDCYFIITILLPDNTEIFQSGLMAPGTSLTKIKLSKIPEPGVYENAILRYSCFDLETLKGLNGANTKMILEVRQ